MDRWKGKVAVVTGVSSGIGAAIAERLVEEGLQVVGLARRVERVEELSKKLCGKPGRLHAIKSDISKEEDVIQAFEWTSKNVGPVKLLVNNAGVGVATNLTDGDTSKWKTVFDTNVLGLCVATREAVKIMRTNNIDGHIIHINSVVGHKVPNIPNFNVYPASKHAVTALTETLRQELNQLGSKIKITSISPGAVATENMKKLDSKLAEVFPDMTFLNMEDVADSVVYVISTPKHVQVHELIIKPVGEKF